jgi:hypothetical protein
MGLGILLPQILAPAPSDGSAFDHEGKVMRDTKMHPIERKMIQSLTKLDSYEEMKLGLNEKNRPTYECIRLF